MLVTGLLGMGLLCLAPVLGHDLLGEWGERWLTLAGAMAEVIGGLTNLSGDAAEGGAVFVVLDLYLIIEGAVRFLSALGGRPMGSVFGWILRPLYRSSLK